MIFLPKVVPWKTWLKNSSLLSKGINPLWGMEVVGVVLLSPFVNSFSWSRRDSNKDEEKKEGGEEAKEELLPNGGAAEGCLWLGRFLGFSLLCCKFGLKLMEETR